MPENLSWAPEQVGGRRNSGQVRMKALFELGWRIRQPKLA